MSRGTTCVLLALLACTAAAKDEKRQLPNGGGVFFNNQFPAALNPFNLVPQVVSALNPFNVVTNIASGLTSVGNVIHNHHIPPLTTTMYIQVTKTYTKNPVCMATASKTLPPCKILNPPVEGHEEEHFDANSAFHIGHGVGVLGQQLLAYPQLANYAAYGPVPQGWAEHEQHVIDDQWHNQVREMYPELPTDLEESESEIRPTAVPKMPEASATVESSRPKRDVNEVITKATPLLTKSKGKRPRYIQGVGPFAKPHIPQVTKTLYVTKVEKVIDPHVTATVVPHNCIPDHVPLCPKKPHHEPHHHHHLHPDTPVKPKPHHSSGHNGHYKSKPKGAVDPNTV